VSGIGVIIEHPVVAGVISIFFCLCADVGNAELRGGSDEEHWCFVSGTFPIRVDEVDEGRDPCEVDNLVVALKAAWGFI
jgi:hypothetical protein